MGVAETDRQTDRPTGGNLSTGVLFVYRCATVCLAPRVCRIPSGRVERESGIDYIHLGVTCCCASIDVEKIKPHIVF